MTFIKEFEDYCQQYGKPERIELLLCDLNAVLRGKWLPGDQVDNLINGKVRLPLSTYAPNIMGVGVDSSGLGLVNGDPDGIIVPILGTLKPVPWAEEPTAQLMIDMLDETGEISYLSPREQLTRVAKNFNDNGWHPVAAAELEFYVIEERQDPNEAPVPPIGSPEAQNYDMESLSRFQGMLDDILQASEQQGLATDTLIAEFGPGQFEVNFHHTNDILKAADTALLFRRIVRYVAKKYGLEATFMAKPYKNYPGSGMHLHVSVLDDDGKNIFTPEDKEQTHISLPLEYAVAGVLDTMREMQAVFAPHMNSLRRFGLNGFAPNAPEWGYDHRGAAIRIPEVNGPGARLEHRICGADVNPYLAITAILGGMLHGLKTKPQLTPPLDTDSQNAIEPLDSNWLETITRFSNSAFAKSLYGEDYHHVFTQVKLNEVEEISTEISPIEYRLYLSRL
ncbi:MAG: glutamine synthetase family protein [Marinomonas colpomeniae]